MAPSANSAVASIPGSWLVVFTVLVIGVFYGSRKQYKKWSVYSRNKRVILFTKYPIPGVAKTRLIPTLGEVGSARLQHMMTDHMLAVLSGLQNVIPDVCLEVKYFGGSKNNIKNWLDRKPGLIWSEQSGNNLGDKMANAFKSAFKQGAEHVVIIGADIPGIKCHILKEAFDKLDSKTIKDKVVLGPAADGGYYLIGLSQHNKSTLDGIMRDITWSTATVLTQQEEKANQEGLSVVMLSKVLQDIDTTDDLPVMEKETNITISQILTPKLSVIIPTLNEVDNIGNTIAMAIQHCTWPDYMELIICDGGSQDGTIEKVQEMIKNNVKYNIRIIQCPKGRGKQQRAGVNESTGDILLFLHAETLLPDNYFETILLTLGTPGVSGGAFKFDLDQLHSDSCPKFFRMKLELLKWGVNMRGDWNELPYGDQALFVTRQMLNKLGGFPDIPLMEDYALVKSLQKHGHVRVAEEAVITSARRWQKYGYVKPVVWNFFIITAYNIGVKPETLVKWYYGKDKRA